MWADDSLMCDVISVLNLEFTLPTGELNDPKLILNRTKFEQKHCVQNIEVVKEKGIIDLYKYKFLCCIHLK